MNASHPVTKLAGGWLWQIWRPAVEWVRHPLHWCMCTQTLILDGAFKAGISDIW